MSVNQCLSMVKSAHTSLLSHLVCSEAVLGFYGMPAGTQDDLRSFRKMPEPDAQPPALPLIKPEAVVFVVCLRAQTRTE